MISLRDLQLSFLDGALRGNPESVAQWIVENGIEPERRITIYRNNTSEGFLKTLTATFPVIVALSGEDWFRQTGREYMRRFPSRSGNLHFVGQHFATFLDETLRDSDYAYFADVARLEWAYQEVLVAAEHPALDPHELARLARSGSDSTSIGVRPALRLVQSSYPILSIWKANQPGAEPTHISLQSGASRVLVIRRSDHVELRELPPGEFMLLSALSQGFDLDLAWEAASRVEPTLDAGAALARLVHLQTLILN